MSVSLRTAVSVAVAAYVLLLVYPAILEPTTTWYRLSTAVQSVRNLLSLPRSDIEACIEAYQFLQNGTRTTDTAETTAHVRAYYKVLQEVLAVADIEKMYIPPQLDSKLGLFGNQLLIEQQVASDLQVVAGDRVLDIGCGRGRVAHHVATLTGAHVSGYNIDPRQIENANAFAAAEGMQDQLSFQEGDHHLRWGYDDASFDAAYDMQALWPFINKANGELEHVASEMFRVLKPGARFSGIDYLLTEWFDWNNPKYVLRACGRKLLQPYGIRVRFDSSFCFFLFLFFSFCPIAQWCIKKTFFLATAPPCHREGCLFAVHLFDVVRHENLHRLFLPTLAATQSNYHTDVTNALQAAGFQVR